MKTMLVVLVALTGIVSATAVISGPLEGSMNYQFTAAGDTLCSYLLDVDDYEASYGSGLFNIFADDFTLDGEYTLTGFGAYSICPNPEQPEALDISVIIYDDDDPGPGQEIWNHHPTALTYTDTGIGQYGVDIFYTYHELNNTTQFTTQANTTYWIASFLITDFNWYISGGTTVHGSEAYQSVEEGDWSPASQTAGTSPVDMFMVLEGSPLGLENCTWGRIKNIF